MSVHSQDSDNEELGGGNKTVSRQVSPFSRPSSVVIMESLLKQQSEQNKQQTEYLLQQQREQLQQQQRENMQQQQEQMQQQQRELLYSINSLKDTTLADI